MLRKRSRSVQKDQYKGHHLMSDSASESNFQNENLGQKQKSSSFFSVPGLFIGFSIKGDSDSDSVRSPNSPLDYKVVTNLGNPRSGPNGSHSSWNSSKVGLGIVDSLDDVNISSENVVGLSGNGEDWSMLWLKSEEHHLWSSPLGDAFPNRAQKMGDEGGDLEDVV
ncbi:hypothetical protein FRX31_035220 [Thalictrum thalictroides]|uniref:Uncharacterized protein n=1 Tax=Thalictrum thalictroides TaxID=46969 RepID=A0A7J6USF9_THATH|nr:hypothetical protein FRX31_035220 [Thalictrum thalictroides]